MTYEEPWDTIAGLRAENERLKSTIAKWRKLYRDLQERNDDLTRKVWKLIEEKRPREDARSET